MHRDPAVMATLGGVRSPGTTRRFLATNVAHWVRHGRYHREVMWHGVPHVLYRLERP